MQETHEWDFTIRCIPQFIAQVTASCFGMNYKVVWYTFRFLQNSSIWCFLRIFNDFLDNTNECLSVISKKAKIWIFMKIVIIQEWPMVISRFQHDLVFLNNIGLSIPCPCLTGFPCVVITIIMIKRSWGLVIFIMAISLLVRRHLYTEIGPWPG